MHSGPIAPSSQKSVRALSMDMGCVDFSAKGLRSIDSSEFFFLVELNAEQGVLDKGCVSTKDDGTSRVYDSLDLSYNKLTSLNFVLPEHHTIRSIHAAHNRLSQFSRALPPELWAIGSSSNEEYGMNYESGNKTSFFANLRIESFNLSYNSIRDVSFPGNVHYIGITFLDLSSNDIHYIHSSLRECIPNLQILILDDNCLTAFPSPLPDHIAELSIRDNLIDSWHGIKVLSSNAATIHTLHLEGNPFWTAPMDVSSFAIPYILWLLPKLHVLNTYPIYSGLDLSVLHSAPSQHLLSKHTNDDAVEPASPSIRHHNARRGEKTPHVQRTYQDSHVNHHDASLTASGNWGKRSEEEGASIHQSPDRLHVTQMDIVRASNILFRSKTSEFDPNLILLMNDGREHELERYLRWAATVELKAELPVSKLMSLDTPLDGFPHHSMNASSAYGGAINTSHQSVPVKQFEAAFKEIALLTTSYSQLQGIVTFMHQAEMTRRIFAARVIQRFYRGFTVRHRMRQAQSCPVTIPTPALRTLVRVYHLQCHRAALRIQRLWRGHIARLAYRKLYEAWWPYRCAFESSTVHRFQRVGRGYINRKAFRKAHLFYEVRVLKAEVHSLRRMVLALLSYHESGGDDKSPSRRSTSSIDDQSDHIEDVVSSSQDNSSVQETRHRSVDDQTSKSSHTNSRAGQSNEASQHRIAAHEHNLMPTLDSKLLHGNYEAFTSETPLSDEDYTVVDVPAEE